MVNKSVFKTQTREGSKSKVNTKRPANTVNEAGGIAYSCSNKQALARLVCTGCFNNTYYVNASDQANKIIDLCKLLEDDFIAKCAMYARSRGYMKDTPALLVAILSTRDYRYFEDVFNIVINNGKMLRNFVQIIRSGLVGRKSFGTRIKKAIINWLNNRTDDQLFRDSVGNNPSLGQIIKMVHPKPLNMKRSALYRYLIGKKVDNIKQLPKLVQQYEKFKQASDTERELLDVPDVPFQLIDNLKLSPKQWAELAKNGGWHMVRMNLNTFGRHKVYDIPGVSTEIANKLRDKKNIERSMAFPYQLMTTANNVSGDVPRSIINALHDAMEHAVSNIPEIKGKTYIFIDTSGSMNSPITGERGTSTSKTRCVDVAALIAASIARTSDNVTVIAFDTTLHPTMFNAIDSIITNANHLKEIGGGGTNCSLGLNYLNNLEKKADTIIYISDNQSWLDNRYAWYKGTGMSQEWDKFKSRNKNAKLVCIDLTPNTSVQVKDREGVLNIGGFSDSVFEIIAQFINSPNEIDHWVNTIESIQIGV